MRLLRIDSRNETKLPLIYGPKPGERYGISGEKDGALPISHWCIWRDSALHSCDGAIRVWRGGAERRFKIVLALALGLCQIMP